MEGKGLAPPAPHEIPTTLRTVGGTHYTPFTLPARPPPPLSPAAVYTAVEFARGKGWVKRSKPTARPSEQREGTWGAALGGDGGKSVRPLWCRFGTLRACHFFLCAATCFPFSKCCTALLWYLCRLTVRSYPTFAPPPPPQLPPPPTRRSGCEAPRPTPSCARSSEAAGGGPHTAALTAPSSSSAIQQRQQPAAERRAQPLVRRRVARPRAAHAPAAGKRAPATPPPTHPVPRAFKHCAAAGALDRIAIAGIVSRHASCRAVPCQRRRPTRPPLRFPPCSTTSCLSIDCATGFVRRPRLPRRGEQRSVVNPASRST